MEATMTRNLFATLMTAATLALISTALFAQARSVVATAARAANPDIVKASDGYLKAVLAADAHGVAACYTEDGVELPNGQPPVLGRSAIEQRYRDFFNAAKVTTFSFSHIESKIEGTVAYDAGTYEMRLMFRDGRVASETGKYLVLLRRVEGAWKATYTIYNSNTMPGTPPKLAQ
jgi:uncharacterized protein (TIGR02246 family)